MTLWHLLVAVAFCSGFSGAFATAYRTHAGVSGWLVALGVGGALAYATFRMHRLSDVVGRRWLADTTANEWRFRGMYLLAMIWAAVVSVLGTVVTRVWLGLLG